MSITEPQLYDKMLNAGVEIANHCSDLYVPVNEITRSIVNDYQFKANVTQFTSNIDGKQWFDIPFAFLPWWEAREFDTLFNFENKA